MTRYQFWHTSAILSDAAQSSLPVSSSIPSYIQKDSMKWYDTK